MKFWLSGRNSDHRNSPFFDLSDAEQPRHEFAGEGGEVFPNEEKTPFESENRPSCMAGLNSFTQFSAHLLTGRLIGSPLVSFQDSINIFYRRLFSFCYPIHCDKIDTLHQNVCKSQYSHRVFFGIRIRF